MMNGVSHAKRQSAGEKGLRTPSEASAALASAVWLVFLLLSTLVGCASTGERYTSVLYPTPLQREAVDPKEVTVFRSPGHLPKEFSNVALFVVQGWEYEGAPVSFKKLRKRAAKLGANGLIVLPNAVKRKTPFVENLRRALQPLQTPFPMGPMPSRQSYWIEVHVRAICYGEKHRQEQQLLKSGGYRDAMPVVDIADANPGGPPVVDATGLFDDPGPDVESVPGGARTRQTDGIYQEGLRLYDAGDYDIAWKKAYDVLQQDPEHWASWQLIGNCQYAKGDETGALVSYRRSLEINGDNPGLSNWVAHLVKCGEGR